MEQKRKMFFAGCMVGLAVLAIVANVLINRSLSKGEKEPAQQSVNIEAAAQPTFEAQEEEDYFEVFRQDRDSVREKEAEYLAVVAQDKESDEEVRAQAQEQILQLSKAMEQEVLIEGLIKAKGFDQAAVTIQQGSVNVVVGKRELKDSEVAQILDIVCTESGEKAENVKIIPLVE